MRDMVIICYIDFTGSISLQWHIKQALPQNMLKEDKQSMLICIEKSELDIASHHTKSVKAQSTCTEVDEALRKVVITKNFQ